MGVATSFSELKKDQLLQVYNAVAARIGKRGLRKWDGPQESLYNRLQKALVSAGVPMRRKDDPVLIVLLKDGVPNGSDKLQEKPQEEKGKTAGRPSMLADFCKEHGLDNRRVRRFLRRRGNRAPYSLDRRTRNALLREFAHQL
jgi:hypothetical protein